jgi:hypothetical protein
MCPAVPRTVHKCPAVPRSGQRCLALPSSAQNCPELPSVAQNCPAVPRSAQNCAALPKSAQKCPAVPSLRLLQNGISSRLLPPVSACFSASRVFRNIVCTHNSLSLSLSRSLRCPHRMLRHITITFISAPNECSQPFASLCP